MRAEKRYQLEQQKMKGDTESLPEDTFDEKEVGDAFEEPSPTEEPTEKIAFKKLAPALGICLAGLVICLICAPMTTSVNGGVGLGLLILCVGTVLVFRAFYLEVYRLGIETPFPFRALFPSYPIVRDRDEISRRLGGFRNALGEFLASSGILPNSRIQEYSSQLLWHGLMLWKKRMDKKGITLSLESSRRAYTKAKTSVRGENYFDGRYEVNDISEEIDAVRTFTYKGRVIKSIHDKEVAHYSLLSAKTVEDEKDKDKEKVICPNCGSVTTRSNLIDGCDYCDTKFTVEDMSNSVGSFGFRRDFLVSESKREVVTELIYPWVFIITEMPFVYFGFFGAFLYMEESFFARLITGIVAGGLLGLVGYCIVKFNIFFIGFLVEKYSASWHRANQKIVYRSKEEIEQEKRIAEQVRGFDFHFSLQSFFGGVSNKLMALHFAEEKEQVNAFADHDLSACLEAYKDVVDVDIVSLKLAQYSQEEGFQSALVYAEIILRKFVDEKIKTGTEHVRIRLEKSTSCRTQAVCGPSILKCSSCGSSLSLMEGKKCLFCGHELDLKKYDWVITGYEIEQ